MSTGIDQSSGLRIVDNGPRFSEGDVVANRFEVQGFAGEGSMGIVYRALDRQSGEPVALKVLQLSDRINVERFRQEAALLARLKHPGIVRYVDHGTTPTPSWAQ